MAFAYIRRAAVALALIATAGCTVKNPEPPPLSGPSGLALTLRLNAIPDSISQDGGSQSSVKVTAIGPDGKPVSALPLRMDMMVNGVAEDFGTLSARSIVTNSDGVATVVYTAPPAPPNGVFTPCASASIGSSLPGSCVSIVASATATNFQTANPESVLIRLVPLGVILPPAAAPTAAFTFSPTTLSAGIPVQFDASTSQPGAGATQITSYSWSFGDGSSATGKTPLHTFAAGNNFVVTLTVTNDRGITSVPFSQTLSVNTASLPTPQFTFSPAAPGVNETIFFNASTSIPGSGHSIVSYRWTFGDGGTASGVTVSHAFATAGTYTVQLTVTDEAGQSVTSAGTSISPGNPPGPTAAFTFSPALPAVGDTVVFDYRTSTTSQGQRIVSLDWNFGDSTPIVHCPGNPSCTSDGITTHAFTRTGSFAVNLVVTDSAGRTNAVSQLVTVGSGNPVPSFTASPNAPRVGEDVTFDAGNTQVFGSATIASYSWNFGDPTSLSNTSSNGPVTNHTFMPTPGVTPSRTITLTVVDSLGRRGSTSVTITVNNP